MSGCVRPAKDSGSSKKECKAQRQQQEPVAQTKPSEKAPQTRPMIEVRPEEWDYGKLRVRRAANQNFTIRNTGDAPLHIARLEWRQQGVFNIASGDPTGTDLDPGRSTSFTVRCSPTAARRQKTTLTIHSNAANSPAVPVDLECLGAEPALKLDPKTKDFGSRRWDDAPVTEEFVLTNPGSDDADVGAVTLTGQDDFSIESEGASNRALRPASEESTARRSIVVRYTPKVHGAARAVLKVDSPDVPALTADVTGKGLFPVIRVEPAELDFQNFRVNDKSVSRKLTIHNDGDAPMTITSIAVADDPGSCCKTDDQKPWDASVAEGKSTEVWTILDPKQHGKVEAKLKITSDAVNAKVLDVPLKAAVFSIESLRVPDYLASGEDEVDVLYQVNDAAGVINELKLEIISKDGGDTVIHTKSLDAKYYKDGERTYEKWKGEVTSSGEYPDGFATIAHSPYVFRLTASAPNLASTPKGDSTAVVEKEFKVEAEKLVIEPGPRTVLKNKKFQDVYDGSLPASSDTDPKKLYLESNIFCQKWLEDHANNSTDFDEYEKLWGDGPLIPICATVFIKSASGPSKPAPFAWGKAEVLWDYEDVPTATTGLSAKQAAFVSAAQDRWKANSKPPGDNCPGDEPNTSSKDIGGKRTLPGNIRRVLPESSAYPSAELNAFPFTCAAAPDPRPWCVYSTPNKSEPSVKGKTGIVFRPSRMAGDRYRVKAYLDIKKEHYKAKNITEPIADSTGIFETWRRLHIQKVYSKDHTNIVSFTHSEVAQQYKQAFIDLVDSAGGPSAMPADYNTAFRDAINGRSETLMKDRAVDDKDNQLTKSPKAAMALRSYEDFKQSYVAASTAPNPENALHVALSAANDSEAASNYNEQAYRFATSVTEKACDTLLADARGDGVVVFLFEYVTNQDSVYQSTNGQAIFSSTPGTLPNIEGRRSRTGYMQFKPAAKYEAPQTITQTVAHEIGHQVFLPHTKMETNAADPAAHDAGHFGCLMSYSFDVTREFCGYCLLRLRGWNHTRLSNRISQNGLQPAIQVTASGAFAGSGTERTFTIANPGNAPLAVTAISLASGDTADFRIDGAPALPLEIAASSTATFKLIFDPKSGGEKNVEVSVASNAPDSPKTLPLNATGKDPVLTLSVDTGALAPADYGRVAADTDAVRTFTVKNTGDGTLRIGQIRVEGDHAMEFALSNDQASNQSLARNQQQTFRLAFQSRLQGGEADKRKQIEGARSAKLLIPSNALDAPRLVDIQAETFLPAILSVTPAPLQLDETEVNCSSGFGSLTIKNEGGLPQTVTRIECAGADRAMFECSDLFSGGDVWTGSIVLDPGKYEFRFFTFKPTGTAGAKSCTLTATSDAPNSPVTVTLQGTAKPGVARLELEFDQSGITGIAAGSSAFKGLYIYNRGGAALNVARIERSGPDAAMFESSDLDPTGVWTGTEAVTPGNYHTIYIDFAPPNGMSSGPKTCTIEVTSDAPGSPHTIVLNGSVT